VTIQEVVEKSKKMELFRLPGSNQSLFPVYRDDGTPTGTLFCSLFDPETNERINIETAPFDVAGMSNCPWTPGTGAPTLADYQRFTGHM
jgi:hypothetical protein